MAIENLYIFLYLQLFNVNESNDGVWNRKLLMSFFHSWIVNKSRLPTLEDTLPNGSPRAKWLRCHHHCWHLKRRTREALEASKAPDGHGTLRVLVAKGEVHNGGIPSGLRATQVSNTCTETAASKAVAISS